MEAKTGPATRKETQKFTWKISNFSMVKQTKLYSDTFSAGGHKWRILAFPKGNSVNHFSLFAEITEMAAMADGWSVPAEISLAVLDQLNGRSCVKSFTHTFKRAEKVLGFKSFIRNSDLFDDGKGFLVNDTLLIEAEVSTEATPSEQADREPKISHVHIDLESEQEIQDDWPQASPLSAKVARSSTMTSPHSSSSSPSVQYTSKNLISELATMSSRWRSSPCDDCLEEQREELVYLFEMSLEKISKADLFEEVEKIILKIADHVTDTLKVMVLKDMVSRLAEFKETIPDAISTLESSDSVETSIVAASKSLEARLGHRKDQLSSLEAEVSRLDEQEMKLEADIQRMVALRDKTRDQKHSTIAELENAIQEALNELEELRKNDEERKRLGESRMRAKERLAQSNASWKLFKENLGL